MQTVPCKFCGRPVVFAVDEKGTKQVLDASAPVFAVARSSGQCRRVNGNAALAEELVPLVSHYSTCTKLPKIVTANPPHRKRCTNCGQVGHNTRTCALPLKHSGFVMPEQMRVSGDQETRAQKLERAFNQKSPLAHLHDAERKAREAERRALMLLVEWREWFKSQEDADPRAGLFDEMCVAAEEVQRVRRTSNADGTPGGG